MPRIRPFRTGYSRYSCEGIDRRCVHQMACDEIDNTKNIPPNMRGLQMDVPYKDLSELYSYLSGMYADVVCGADLDVTSGYRVDLLDKFKDAGLEDEIPFIDCYSVEDRYSHGYMPPYNVTPPAMQASGGGGGGGMSEHCMQHFKVRKECAVAGSGWSVVDNTAYCSDVSPFEGWSGVSREEYGVYSAQYYRAVNQLCGDDEDCGPMDSSEAASILAYKTGDLDKNATCATCVRTAEVTLECDPYTGEPKDPTSIIYGYEALTYNLPGAEAEISCEEVGENGRRIIVRQESTIGPGAHASECPDFPYPDLPSVDTLTSDCLCQELLPQSICCGETGCREINEDDSCNADEEAMHIQGGCAEGCPPKWACTVDEGGSGNAGCLERRLTGQYESLINCESECYTWHCCERELECAENVSSSPLDPPGGSCEGREGAGWEIGTCEEHCPELWICEEVEGEAECNRDNWEGEFETFEECQENCTLYYIVANCECTGPECTYCEGKEDSITYKQTNEINEECYGSGGSTLKDVKLAGGAAFVDPTEAQTYINENEEDLKDQLNEVCPYKGGGWYLEVDYVWDDFNYYYCDPPGEYGCTPYNPCAEGMTQDWVFYYQHYGGVRPPVYRSERPEDVCTHGYSGAYPYMPNNYAHPQYWQYSTAYGPRFDNYEDAYNFSAHVMSQSCYCYYSACFVIHPNSRWYDDFC